ncbi:CybS-domain-containing protein [Mortierella sp. GBAus27b]|nr:CybS-domain-containing protein [Mortierella sp. GBAus27b]
MTSSDVTDVYKAVPYKTIPPNSLHGSYHWDFERLLTISIVPLFAASAFQGAHPITDGLLGVVIPIHAHLGFDAMITDYLHPGKVGNGANKAFSWALRGATVLVLVGCYQFNTSDVGLTELVKRAWQA